MIDLHCHILPGLDDGPQTLEESLAMVEIALEDGINTIVATPHMQNGLYRNYLEQVRSAVSSLEEVLAERGLPLRLYVGGDVHIKPDMMAAVQAGEAVTIDDARKYILIELPSMSVPAGVKEEIFQLRIHGITPIITHPERNQVIARAPELLEEMVAMGALAQVTAMSLTGGFGRIVRESAEALVVRRLVHIIASDAHSVVDRPPLLSRALERSVSLLGDRVEAERMVTILPAAILAGDPVA